MRLVQGNLGRATFKTSAVVRERWTIEAPARIFDDQDDVIRAYKAGELDRDVIVVVRFQGPRANGMPELHKLTPALGVLQDKGFRVALLTDGRMSGASGKVPAAIHVSPEALAAARSRGCATAISCGCAGMTACWSCWLPPMSLPPANRRRCRQCGSAPAASCSPSCATAPATLRQAVRLCWQQCRAKQIVAVRKFLAAQCQFGTGKDSCPERQCTVVGLNLFELRHLAYHLFGRQPFGLNQADRLLPHEPSNLWMREDPFVVGHKI
jgi:hypothetical protein